MAAITPTAPRGWQGNVSYDAAAGRILHGKAVRLGAAITLGAWTGVVACAKHSRRPRYFLPFAPGFCETFREIVTEVM